VLYVRNTSQKSTRGRSAGRTRGRGHSYQGITVQSRDDQNWKNTATCHKCGKIGHIARDCPQTEVERKIRELKSQLAKLKLESESVHLIEDETEEDSNEATVNACLAAFAPEEDDWFLDSGASSHITGNERLVSNITTSAVPSIRTANGQVLPVTAKGNVTIQEVTGEIKSIRNVLYVPGVRSNLLSVGKFADLGHVVLFNSTQCLIFDKDDPDSVYLRAHRDKNSKFYRLQGKSVYHDLPSNAAMLSSSISHYRSRTRPTVSFSSQPNRILTSNIRSCSCFWTAPLSADQEAERQTRRLSRLRLLR
jgi:hypothetical protein